MEKKKVNKKKTVKTTAKKTTKTVKKTVKNEKKKKKGFTLIELLAVIIILGILMIIAIPSVTRYINDSRKSAYVDTAKEIVAGTRNLVNEGKFGMYDTDTTYYINAECIETENALKSPYGDFTKAYVVVTYNGQGYDYYWTSVDDAGQGIKKIINVDKLDTDLIDSDLTENDIQDSLGINGRSKYVIIDKQQTNCGKGVSTSVTGNVNGSTGDVQFSAVQVVSQVSEIENVAEAKRYVGADPANYVKFNGNELWRIIGIYGDSIKIIRSDSIGESKYNNSATSLNPWANSYLKNYLNDTYYQSLSNEAKNMIKEDGVWYVGAVPDAANAPTVFDAAKLTTWTGKVGLIATYEYLYATTNEDNCWNKVGYMDFGSSGCARRDWLNNSSYLWTISPSDSYQYLALCILTHVYRCSPTSENNIKPVVYLKPTVYITGGTGTASDPYIFG